MQSDWAANDQTGLSHIKNKPPLTYNRFTSNTKVTGAFSVVGGDLTVSGNIVGAIDYSHIVNVPSTSTLATVATTGNYADLINKPTPTQWSTSGSLLFYNGGNVGIGTTNPTSTLHVNGSLALGGAIFGPSTSGNIAISGNRADVWDGIQFPHGTLRCGSTSGANFGFHDGTDWVFKVDTIKCLYAYGGAVILGDSEVYGLLKCSNPNGWIGAAIRGNGIPGGDRIVAGTLSGYGAAIGAHNDTLSAWATCCLINATHFSISDCSAKENIVSADNQICYDSIKALPLVRFNYNSNIAPGLITEDKTITGLLAQDLEKVFPKSVRILDTGGSNATDGMKSINLDQVNYTMIGAVQQLMGVVESLTSNVSLLTARITALGG